MERRNTLNVVVTGQLRCGASVIQTSLMSCVAAVCYPELLHPQDRVRQRLHAEAFGPSPEGMPLHFTPGHLSAEQYLNQRVFDQVPDEQMLVGVKIPYPHIDCWSLWEYLHDNCQAGDFAVIHVLRNPLACYVSLKQAEASGRWYQMYHETEADVPGPVHLDVRELTTFCRTHSAHEAKLRQTIDDLVELDYKELFLNYQATMQGVFAYLETSPCPGCEGCPCVRITPGVRRLKNRGIRERVINFAEAREKAPHDVQVHFDADNLF